MREGRLTRYKKDRRLIANIGHGFTQIYTDLLGFIREIRANSRPKQDRRLIANIGHGLTRIHTDVWGFIRGIRENPRPKQDRRLIANIGHGFTRIDTDLLCFIREIRVNPCAKQKEERGTRAGACRRWGWWLAILAFIVVSVAGARALQAQTPKRHVLLINSYHEGLSWTDGITDGVRAVLLDPQVNPEAENIELYIDYMDTKRVVMSEEHIQIWFDLMREKYAGIVFDVILVSDDNAFDFLRDYHEDLFPQTPVIFCGVNFLKPEQIAGIEDTFVGVSEDVDIRETLDLALTLHPQARRVVVVNDDTFTGQIVQRELEGIKPEYETFDDRPIEFVNLVGLSVTALRARLAEQPTDSVVLMILLNRDSEGVFFTYEEGIALVRNATTLPIYGLWDFYLGYGMLGGRVANAFAQGEAAAELALRVLQGERVANLDVVRSPNRYMFDYDEMVRFGITRAQLPGYSDQWPADEFSIVLNAPPPFLEQYGAYVMAGVVGLLVAGVILLIQGNYLRKQRQIQASLEEANQALEATRISLEHRVAARTQDLAQRSEQLKLASFIARDAAGIRDVNQLMRTIVDLISRSFGFYHAGIFLVDQHREYAVLHAASSEGGKAMLARGHRLRVADQGIVGYVAAWGKPRIALDVGGDVEWFDNPDLPETRSEMGLPLMLRDEVIGVLDVQSTEPQAFTEEDISVLQIMADQLTLAIHNARLFEESQVALERLEAMYGERVRHVWAGQVPERAYHYDGITIRPAASQPASAEVSERLVIPIPLGGMEIGSIVLERAEGQDWSREELSLAQAVSVQAGLALENARLLAETQARAEQERLISDVSARIRETLDVDSILQMAARQFRAVMDLDKVEIRVGLADAPHEEVP